MNLKIFHASEGLSLVKLISFVTSKPREIGRLGPHFNAYWYLNQRVQPLSSLLMCGFPFIFYDTNMGKDRRWDVAEDTPGRSYAGVDKCVTVVRVSTEAVALTISWNQVRIIIWFEDTDKFECCHWFKCIILIFISFKKFCWIWEYSKIKIGHNFLPGLDRSNLNADLNLSALRKKVISKFKIVWTSDAFLI